MSSESIIQIVFVYHMVKHIELQHSVFTTQHFKKISIGKEVSENNRRNQ